MKRTLLTVAIILLLGSMGCEKPAPREKTPEHTACLERAEAYFECKTTEASGAGSAVEKQVKRMVEGNRRRAEISQEKCEAVLAKVTPEDSCQP